ncbi:MAG: tetratricopeptide repeat protein [Candidatus Limnocylindrales bacterium]
MKATAESTDLSAEVLMGQVVEEFMERLDHGEHPDIESYVQDYPQLAAVLRQMLPALELIRISGVDLASAAEPLSSDFDLRMPVGDYRILRQIGRGGMGVVYEAQQLSLARRVALKVLPFAAALDAKQLQRFKNEAQAAACLHHTNIVPVYAVGCERGVHFYAMQFIEGQSLAEVIAELRQALHGQGDQPASSAPAIPTGRNDPTEDVAPVAAAKIATTAVTNFSTEHSIKSPSFFRKMAKLGVQAAEGLDYAHELGVIHRDIKPANLLVDLRGNLWITDFGLAHCQSQVALTMTGDLLGTLRYMSPEQALANRLLIDHRTDIYSLGVTLYELLTLEPVFNGRDRQELLRQIAFEEPKPPRKLNKTIPAELETIVLMALEKNPVDRYGTAQELADDLERFLKDEPIQAKRPTLVQRARKWARRHKAVVGAAVVVLVVVALVVTGEWLRFMQKRAATAEQVNLALKEATVLQEQQKWGEALAAVKRAAAVLAYGSGDAELRKRTQELGKDLKIAVQLDDLRIQKTHYDGPNAGFYVGTAPADISYAMAFEAYGIEVLADPPQRVAASIKARSICEQLVAALDDWILVQSDAGVRERLRAIAELADPDEWRNRTRKAVVANDRRGLEELAARPEVASFPPATGYLLGQALTSAGAGPRAVQVLSAFQQRHPQDFLFNFQLGCQLLWGPGVQQHPDNAAGYLRAALVARPDFPTVYTYLGIALPAPDHLDEVIALNRKAIELDPAYYTAHVNLGIALGKQGKHGEAEAEHRQALRLQPDFQAHLNLGVALFEQRKYAEAEAEFREVLRLRPDFPEAHNNLGNALKKKGKLVEAEAEFREALRLRPDLPEAHNSLGAALFEQRKYAEAEAEHRQALRLRPDNPVTHSNLGAALAEQGKHREAEAECREALRLRPDYPTAHNNLGIALGVQRKNAEAAAEYAAAFAAEPKWAEDLRNGDRYNAACVAALAGCGQGENAAKLDEKERARLRRQALAWLRADLAAWGQLLEKEPDKARAAVRKTLRHWQQDADFAGVRGDALAKLPEAERQPWRQLWAEVERTLRKANDKDTKSTKKKPAN